MEDRVAVRWLQRRLCHAPLHWQAKNGCGLFNKGTVLTGWQSTEHAQHSGQMGCRQRR